MARKRKCLRSRGKAPKNQKTLDVDRLSNLPNELICHILSFLPTKDAIATSVLSTKWKNLFPLIPNLRLLLEDKLLLHPESASDISDISFMNFVDRLFNVTLLDVPSIHTLILICLNFNEGRKFADWVNAALNLKVKTISVCLRQIKNSNFLLDSLFGCKITTLHLALNFADTPEYRFSLPNVKTLSVHMSIFGMVNVLLEGCPLLEFLLMNNCYDNQGARLRICISSLKRFRFINTLRHLQFEMELDCPNLETLSLLGFLANRYWMTRMNGLQIAVFDLHQNAGQCPHQTDAQAAELVTFCSGVQKLWLSEKFTKILNRLLLGYMPRSLPQFRNLVTLAIINTESNGWEYVQILLKCATRLRKLFFKRGFDKKSYESSKASAKESWSVCFFAER